jgi:hypothetical protein
MASLVDQVKLHIEKLITLKLSRIARAADMRTLQFGNTKTRLKGGVVGEYALHVQCPWRLERRGELITGSGDLYVADTEDGKEEKPQDKILRELLKGYDETTGQIVNTTPFFIVETAQADSVGGFSLQMSGDYRFVVFPDSARAEAWRLFVPRGDEEITNDHFVVPHED